MDGTLFGALPDGRDVHVHTIGSDDLRVEVLTLGAVVHRLVVPDRDGVPVDVALGLPDVAERLASTYYLGGTIGRYANRIAGGRFLLDGREVVVGTHDRGNSLHGGPDGFDRRLWTVREAAPDRLVLALTSPDGDQGFPGRLDVEVTYAVRGRTVAVSHRATTDAPTVVNLTNHAYLNLAGEGSGTVDDHLLTVDADRYTPVDGTGIPTGGHEPVDGTPFDLRTPTRVGDAVRSPHEQVVAAQGIDHNLVVRGTGLRRHARLSAAATGIALELWSDQPGVQVYTGNFLDGTRRARDGSLLRQGDGIALEPQLAPDTPHHDEGPDWPSAVLRPGAAYTSHLEWRFQPAE